MKLKTVRIDDIKIGNRYRNEEVAPRRGEAAVQLEMFGGPSTQAGNRRARLRVTRKRFGRKSTPVWPVWVSNRRQHR